MIVNVISWRDKTDGDQVRISVTLRLRVTLSRHQRAIFLFWLTNELYRWCCETGSYYTVAAWYSVRRTVHRRQSSDSPPSRDVEPSSAADDRGRRELVKESQGQARNSSEREVIGIWQWLNGWPRCTWQFYLVYYQPQAFAQVFVADVGRTTTLLAGHALGHCLSLVSECRDSDLIWL